MIAFLFLFFLRKKKRCYYFRLELAFIFRAFDFRDIIFLQNFSELTISLLPEKNKLDSADKLFKLAPYLIIVKVNMAKI